jgi:hypothetical protein
MRQNTQNGTYITIRVLKLTKEHKAKKRTRLTKEHKADKEHKANKRTQS